MCFALGVQCCPLGCLTVFHGGCVRAHRRLWLMCFCFQKGCLWFRDCLQECIPICVIDVLFDCCAVVWLYAQVVCLGLFHDLFIVLRFNVYQQLYYAFSC